MKNLLQTLKNYCKHKKKLFKTYEDLLETYKTAAAIMQHRGAHARSVLWPVAKALSTDGCS